MDQFSLDRQREALPLIHELAKRLLSCESAAAEIKQTLDDLNCKVDFLLARSNVDHPPESSNTFALENVAALEGSGPPFTLTPYKFPHDATVPDQNPTNNGPGVDVREASNRADLSLPIPGAARDSNDVFWKRGLSDFEGFNSLGIFGDHRSQQDGLDLAPLPSTFSDLHTLPPRTIPASMVYRNGVWADPSPPPSRVRTVPLPPVTPSYEIRGDGVDIYENRHGEHEDFSDENETQSEPNTPAVSNPGRGYDRRRSAEEKTQRFALICGALGIPWRGDELSSLRIIIERLGGTVPVIADPAGWVTKSQRQARKRRTRLAHFEELRRLVGPWTTRLREWEVLDKALARVTGREDEEGQGYEPYHVFRL